MVIINASRMIAIIELDIINIYPLLVLHKIVTKNCINPMAATRIITVTEAITNEITKEFSDYVFKNYAKDTNHLVVVIDRGICVFSNDEIKEVLADNKNIPIQFVRLSRLNNDLITVLLTKYKIEKQIVDKNWEIIILKK